MPRTALVILLIGAALRTAAWVHYRDAPLTPAGDDRQYHEMSLALADGQGLSLDGQRSAYRSPLYPVFLAAVHTLPGPPSLHRVRFFQVLISLAALWLLYICACRIAGPRAGLAALTLGALDLTQILLPTSLYLECVFSFLLLVVAWTGLRWIEKPTPRTAGFLGLAIGISLLCRSTLALLPLGALVWCYTRARSRRAFFNEGALLLLAVGLPLVPWVLRNGAIFERFIPLETGVAGPVIFYASEGRIQAPSDQAGPEPMHSMYQDMSHYRWDSYSLALARKNIAAAPLRYAGTTLKRMWMLWKDAYAPYLIFYHPEHAPWIESYPRWNILRGACQAAFLFALAAAIYGLRRRPSLQGWGIAFLILYFNLYALGTVFARFASPVSPLLYILSGAGISAWLSRRKTQRAKPRARKAA